jgi:hypothetical protein
MTSATPIGFENVVGLPSDLRPPPSRCYFTVVCQDTATQVRLCCSSNIVVHGHKLGKFHLNALPGTVERHLS